MATEKLNGKAGITEATVTKAWSFWEKVNIMCFLCLCCVLCGVNSQLLPSSFRGLETSLHTSLETLTMQSTCQGLAQVLSCPFWGSLADHGVSRRQMIAFGCLMWGIVTALLGITDDLKMMTVLRLLNGAALGMVMPIVQSMIADIAPPELRGRLFGIALGAQNIGVTFASQAATAVSSEIIWGFYGWRISFGVVGLISVAASALMASLMLDVPRPMRTSNVDVVAELALLRDYMNIPSFRVIFIQGIFGMFPWSVFPFLIMYFQYIGFSDKMAGSIYMVFTLTNGIGQVLGGYIGDAMSALSPDHGRIATAQMSVALGAPSIFILTGVIGKDTAHIVWYCLLLANLGLGSSWCGSGCIGPILSEIVSQKHMARVYAWSFTLQSFCGMVFAPTAVAFMASYFFDYKSGSADVSTMSRERRETNAAALGQSIMYLSLVPWALCFLCYGLLHRVYPRDKKSA